MFGVLKMLFVGGGGSGARGGGGGGGGLIWKEYRLVVFFS